MCLKRLAYKYRVVGIFRVRTHFSGWMRSLRRMYDFNFNAKPASSDGIFRTLFALHLHRGRLHAAGRSRDCIKAHQSAIEVTKAIAAALREANEAKAEESLARNSSSAGASSPPSTPGQPTDAASDDRQHNQESESSTPSAATPAGAGGEDAAAAAPAATGNTPAANSDGSAAVVVVGQKRDGEEGKTGGEGARPVLTLMQHLCASAPERAEGRARVAEGLSALLPEVEGSDRARFVSFLAKVLLLLLLLCACIHKSIQFVTMLAAWFRVVEFVCTFSRRVQVWLQTSFVARTSVPRRRAPPSPPPPPCCCSRAAVVLTAFATAVQPCLDSLTPSSCC